MGVVGPDLSPYLDREDGGLQGDRLGEDGVRGGHQHPFVEASKHFDLLMRGPYHAAFSPAVLHEAWALQAGARG